MQAPVKNRTTDDGMGESLALNESMTISRAESPNHGPQKVSAETVLEVRDLRKSFRSGFLKRRLRGIEGVTFSVKRGSVFAIIGHNGAGKTTTINCILDLVHPDGGQVKMLGHDHRDPASRARVGYLPERPYFFEHLTGRELLNFYARLLGLPRELQKNRIDEVLEMVGMSAFGGRRLKKFSKGMLQRIGLAQAILGDPEILILDEPMSGLDPIGRREVRELLMGLKRDGKTIILSSHIVPDVEMIADTVGILKDGSLAAIRDLDELHHGYSYTADLTVGGKRPAMLDGKGVTPENGRARLQVQTVDDLRNLLNECHREDIPVQSLETHRSCLEELFMEINGDTASRTGVAR